MGTFFYKVMPTKSLKNAGATYQRAMTAIFHDLMGDIVEDYVDDILVKSKTASQHIQHLEKIAPRLLQYQLRLNPQKCVFGVSSGKLLGFIVSKRGIEADPIKIRAIINMPPPRNIKELRSLLGQLQPLRRFISPPSKYLV